MENQSTAQGQIIAIVPQDWNELHAAIIGGITGASYVFAMCSIASIVSLRSMDLIAYAMLVGAIIGTCTFLGIAAFLNYVKGADRMRERILRDSTATSLARLSRSMFEH